MDYEGTCDVDSEECLFKRDLDYHLWQLTETWTSRWPANMGASYYSSGYVCVYVCLWWEGVAKTQK